ncbi:MAG: hypothetical protein HY645_09830 [Acidobacteria bacterium]|nr:hypothetical protein [Acidobacteriota bacterium]
MVSSRDFIRIVVLGSAGACLGEEFTGVLLASQGGAATPVHGITEDLTFCHRIRDRLAFPTPDISRTVEVAVVGGAPSRAPRTQ